MDKLSKKTIAQLECNDVLRDVLSLAVIETGTWKSKLITFIFNSGATVFGRTIYFRVGYFHPEQSKGLALIAHEVMHIAQWEQGGICYGFKYVFEYISVLIKYLLGSLMGRKYPLNWVHDQISYEKQAMMIENIVFHQLSDE